MSFVHTSAETLSLSQCLSLAAENCLAIKSANAKVERTRTLQGTAWDIEKTELSLSQDPTSGGSPDNALAITQSIEFPTIYAARRGQLKAETIVEEKQRNITIQQIRTNITISYYQLVYEMERLEILKAQDSILSHYVDIAQKRYEVGEVRQLEVLSARKLLRENRLEMESTQSNMEAIQHQLSSQIGVNSTIMPSDKKLTRITYHPREYQYTSTPDGELANSQLLLAEKSLHVAKNGYAPSISFTLKNQLVITGWDPYHENRSRYSGGNFMGFEIGIGVPLFYGATKAKVKAARIEKDITEFTMQQQRLTRQNEYDAALAQYTSAFNRVEYYEKQGTENAIEIVRLATFEYENGEISYIEYINALQESIDSHLKYAAAINDYNQAVIALQSITGCI